MKNGSKWLLFVLVLCLVIQLGFASSIENLELTGHGDENPVSILILDDVIWVVFQSTNRLIRFNYDWVETGELALPDLFTAEEMVVVEDRIYVLDELADAIAVIDPEKLEVIQVFNKGHLDSFVSLFEADGLPVVLDDRGYVYQVDEDFQLLGWLTGVRLYQSATYDGYHLYVGGRIRPAESGVLVMTADNDFEDEWLMSDDSRVPVEKDVVERIRLMPDGFFYVVYQETGIVKYDEYGNYRNRIYRRSGEERRFSDMAYDANNEKYYMVDANAGVFELRWTNDRKIRTQKTQVDTSRVRLSTRTVRGVTTVEVGAGKLSGFYQEEDEQIRLIIPTRDVERLEIKINAEDVMAAQETGIDILEIVWKEKTYLLEIAAWMIELSEIETTEEQYVEVKIDHAQTSVDFCLIERLDEKTKRVRREKLESWN